jgi:microcystin-dependent protein
MPSTYTGSGIELIADGEQAGTWGQTTNTNLEIVSRITSEAGAIALSGTTHTLTISDGILSDGQYGVLVFGGSPSGTNTVTISPNDAKRIFIVRNSSGQSVVLTQGSGGNVTILNGDGAIVYCDGAGAGAAVVDVSTTFITTNNLIVANDLSDLASASTARTNLGVAIGTDVQAYDADLSAIGALAKTDGNFIVGNGSTWVAESGATVRTSLGLGTAATLNVGTSANNIVQLNGSAQLPAVDGSLLTGIVAIPTGAILLWSGSTGTIPSGFVICDGTNSTPDLRDRFIVGAGNTYAVDATGGANTVALSEAELAAHTHSVSGTTASDGDHTHNVSGNTSNTGDHTHNGSTSNTGAHAHSIKQTFPSNNPDNAFTISSNNFVVGIANNAFVNSATPNNTGQSSNTGDHSHNFTTANAGAHSHTLSGTADTAGAHTHTFSTTSGSTGSATAHENRPPYYALAYIMKT